MADRDIPEEMVEKGAQGMATACGRGDVNTLPRDDQEYFRSKARAALSAALAGREVVDAVDPSAMPPVPCPDCMHPTEHDGDVFLCSNCGQAFSTPNGMDLSMWHELWRAWTAGRQVVDLPEPDEIHDAPAEARWHTPPDSDAAMTAYLNANGTPEVVTADDDYWSPDDLERDGLARIAAARYARRLAAGSGSGED